MRERPNVTVNDEAYLGRILLRVKFGTDAVFVEQGSGTSFITARNLFMQSLFWLEINVSHQALHQLTHNPSLVLVSRGTP